MICPHCLGHIDVEVKVADNKPATQWYPQTNVVYGPDYEITYGPNGEQVWNQKMHLQQLSTSVVRVGG